MRHTLHVHSDTLGPGSLTECCPLLTTNVLLLAADDIADSPDALFQQLALTVLQQSTLCPLPLVVQPVHWAHDHALQLYPLPHALVLADASPQASTSHEGCTVFNPVSLTCFCSPAAAPAAVTQRLQHT